MWYNYHGTLGNRVLLTVLFLMLLSMLSATGFIRPPQGINVPFFGVWPRLSDSAKSALSFALVFVWTPFAMRLVPDTYVGAAIILVPDALLILAAFVYLSNGLSANIK
jgi:hypothetical protein